MSGDLNSLNVRTIGDAVRTWGRWGSADELGSLNYATPETVRAAATLVRNGVVISMAVPIGQDGPQPAGGRRSNPVHTVTETAARGSDVGDFRFADDMIEMHLQAATHWDALAHGFYDGTLYNGYVASDVIGPDGAKRCSVQVAASSIVGRGVLLDIPRARGVQWLEAGDAISPADLDAAAAAEAVSIKEGDFLVIRTGWWAKYLATGDRAELMSGEPGLSVSCAIWLFERRVAAVCADNGGVEVAWVDGEGRLRFETADQSFPLHMIALRDMGMMFGELFDVEGLGVACAADGHFDFLFIAPPLPVTGGIGSPVNPIAVK